MKIIPRMSLGVVPAVLLLLGGCATTPEQPAPPAAEAPPSATLEAAPATQTGTGGTQAMEPANQAPVDPVDDPNHWVSRRTVYFDFDRSVIDGGAVAVIKAHAAYLVANAKARMMIEGHCDERGTREYNMALGERRADAVRRLLIATGAAPAQIRIVSYGEERPAVLGHDEGAWGPNRRAELVYTHR